MRSSLSLAFCLLLAGAAEAQDINVITSVEVRSEGSTVLVTVKGSKPPNFTTFSMADPPRFVIDLSEARFQGVPEDLRVEDGVIKVIKNLGYGSGATAIARVMLAFSVDVEPPDVQTDGTSLLVRMSKPGGAAVAAAGAPPAGAAPAVAEASAPAAAAPAATGAVSGASATAEAGAGAAGVAVAVAGAAAGSEAADAERQEALARQQREAEASEQARLAAEASAREREAQARAETEARAREAERAAAEQAAAEEAARAAAEARSAEIKAKAAAETAAVAAAESKPDAAATGSESAARTQAEADARARREVEEALAAQLAAQQPAAATPSKAPAPVPAPAADQAPPEVPARAAKLQAVGFKQLPTVSRVFVKTSVTPRFTITDVGDDVVRLEVENTRASRRNDTRPLDTSFFPSAVALITPSRVGTSYVVDIKLRKRVPYQQRVEGDVLAIDFERPPALGEGGAAGGSESPSAAAPGSTLENGQGMVVEPEEKPEGAGPIGDQEPAAEPAPKQ